MSSLGDERPSTELARGPLFADRYAYRKELGRGSSGRVIQVADTREGDALRAMKVVPPQEAARLRWEFDLLAGIAHPNVARVYELLRVSEPVPEPFRLAPGDAALIEQQVEGEPADRIADSREAMDDRARFVASAGLCLARGLTAIHAAGMVHGDVKPQNLIVGEGGRDAILIDLGLARPPGHSSRVGGTPGYMAPEAWQGERSVSTDLYALGATLHRLLTGRPPGDDARSRSVAEVVARALSRWRVGGTLPAETPRPLAHLVESLIDPEPSSRPASARQVAGRLAAIVADLGPTPELHGAASDLAAAGAGDVPSPAERAMTMRALPWVGDPSVLRALADAVGAGGVVAVVGPHGAGRSRIIGEAIRLHQERRAEAEQRVPTAIRVESRLPTEILRHDAVVHVQFGDGVDLPEALGLVRAADLDGHRLTVVLERRTAAGDARSFEVGPLSDEQLGLLLRRARGGEAPSPSLVTAARCASGGLAGHLCRILASASAADRDISDPATLEELGLGEDEEAWSAVPVAARRVAELVAVAGGELDPDHAVRALGGAGRFDLLIADGLASLTQEGRLHLRRDVARGLRLRMGRERRVELAAHLDPSLLSSEERAFVEAAAGDALGAAESFLAAVRKRRRLGSVSMALRLSEDALADLGGEGDPEAIRSVLRSLALERADALRALGRYEQADRSLEGWAGPAVDLLRAEVARLRGDAGRARELSAQALEAAGVDVEVRAGAEALLARLDLDEGRLEEAIAHASRAREQAVGEGLDALAARAIEVIALTHAARGELEETGRLAAEAVGRARRGGDRGAEARARSIAATVALRTGRVHAAARGQVDAFELAEAAGEAHAAATFLVNVGLARLDAGEPGPAISALREGGRRLAKLGRHGDLGRTLYNLANAAALVGDDDLAGSAVARALEVAGDGKDATAQAWAWVVRAGLELRGGAEPAARDALQSAEARIPLLTDPTARVAVASRCAIAWLQLGEEVAARDAIERARADAEEAHTAVAAVEWHVAEVRAALHGNETRGAREHAMGAWAAAEQSGLFEMRLRAGFALADVSDAVGDRQAATQALSEVRALLDAAANTLEAGARARMRTVPEYRRAFAEVPDERVGSRTTDARWRQLAHHAKRIASEHRVGRLYESILESAIELSGADRGHIVTRAEDGSLRVRVARGMGREELARDQHAISRSIVARVLDGGRSVATVDALRDADLGGAASIHALDLRSVLAVPLRTGGAVTAAIYLEDRLRPGAFGPEDVELVDDLAGVGGVAIESAERLRAERRTARRLAILQRKLERTVESQALELASLKKSGEGTPLEGSGIVARSESMRRVLALAEKVAGSEVPVLITGESGTGKELVARAIHAHGTRREAPFVTENCSAIPEALLESALFGHVRGAFTGADRARVGLFEAADGGTLFLDEIGEMSAAMQAKLLRVTQSGEIRPVGSERARRVDVRLVAATHRNLEAMVQEGRFREDLYYRLAVVTVPLPPLRDRREDIPLLVAHFLSKHASGRELRLAPAALAILQRRPWPGNVRQLENEVQRAVVLAERIIREEHLSPEPGGDGTRQTRGDLDLKGQVADLERDLIERALERTDGNQTRAAELLGVSRYGLQKMIRRLGVERG